MVGRMGGRLVSSLALVLASVAWASFLFLHTVGDPSRAGSVATAVLSNPAARTELARDIAAAVAKQVSATGYRLNAKDPSLVSGVNDALGDPAVRTNLIQAITVEQQRLLGVATTGTPEIDTALLTASIRQHVSTVDPVLARELTPSLPSVTLPAIRMPQAERLRHFAVTWSSRLALLAVAGLGVAMLIGNRTSVLRRAGVWAIGAGVSWAVLPRLINGAARHLASSQAAMVKAVVHSAGGAVSAPAVALVALGVLAVSLSVFGRGLLGRS